MAVSLFNSFCCLLAVFCASTLTCAQSAANLPQSITLSYESLLPGSQSVKPLAKIFYDPATLKTSISSWTPPSLELSKSATAESTSPHLLRILLPSGSSTLTSLGTFNKSLTQHVDLHLSSAGDGTVFSASVYASTPSVEVPSGGSKSKSKAKTRVEAQQNAQANANVQVKVIAPTAGAAPKLASKKPPIVGPDGKEQPAPEELEKSFFQKYWWIFAIVAVLAMAGGGDK